MSSHNFAIARAAALLQSAGLLHQVILPQGAGVVPGNVPAEDLAQLPGHFLGAGLDNRQLSAGELFVALAGEKSDGRNFAPRALAAGHWALTRAVEGSDDLIGLVAPGGVLVATDPEKALAVLAADWRGQFDIPLVGITGSNGKTTTKDFCAAILAAAGNTLFTQGNFNNKLGLPLTLLRLRPEHQYAVIEMGASAVGHIDHLADLARPTISLITNAGQAHLEEFGSLEAVIQGKGEILDRLPPTGRAILNTDSPGFADWQERATSPVISFGQTEGDFLWSWHAGTQEQPSVLDFNGQQWPVPLPGQHNGANLAAALTVAQALGIPDETIKTGLAAFRPSAHRSRKLSLAGRLVLDDSYNANPASMLAAAETALELVSGGKLILVLGHMAELGEQSTQLHQQTGQQLASLEADPVLLAVGQLAGPLADGFSAAGISGSAVLCLEKTEATDWLLANTRPGDGILVKGSRSAGMEEVVESLMAHWAGKDEQP